MCTYTRYSGPPGVQVLYLAASQLLPRMRPLQTLGRCIMVWGSPETTPATGI